MDRKLENPLISGKIVQIKLRTPKNSNKSLISPYLSIIR